MGLQQVAISVQNDGNVSQLDVADTTPGGVYYRIDVYRASQPSGGYGVNHSGTRVEHLAGEDHLKEKSNRVFRWVYSFGDTKSNKSDLTALIESREEFLDNGGVETRVRDIDSKSESFGTIVRVTVTPGNGKNDYTINYEIHQPKAGTKPTRVSSPIGGTISSLTGLPDLAKPLDDTYHPISLESGVLKTVSKDHASHLIQLKEGSKSTDIHNNFQKVLALFTNDKFKTFRRNIDEFESFGDYGAKPTHPGTNLTGPNVRWATEAVAIRPYRVSLILLGRLATSDMSEARNIKTLAEGHLTNTRPGVYNIFVSAYILGIEVYKLGIDKVHSDYGGVPMKHAPGSRLETNATPVFDASRANQALAEIAQAYYINPNK